MKSRHWVPCVLALSLLTVGSTARAQFVGCTNDQINTISWASFFAGFAMIDAGQDLTSAMQGGDTSRYRTWFGSVDSERMSYVYAVLYAAYAGGLANAVYHCDACPICEAKNTPGCVDPDDPTAVLAWSRHGSALNQFPSYSVFFCPAFFMHPDRQVGTVVHELTHLYGTDDINDTEAQFAPSDDPNYYPDIARYIAATDPNRAVQLAINYEYYVVNP